MSKPSLREQILSAGLRLMFQSGYQGAGVRDICSAARAPQGSFTNHFISKEAFAHEVLNRYFSLVRSNIDKTLRNDSLPPLRRLRAWIDVQIAFLKKAEFRSGCLIGNFSIEASEQSELIRRRLAEMFKDINESIVYCLKAAVDAGELPPSTDIREVGSFLYSSWQGAILQSKVDQSIKPLERFKKVLFSKILH